MPVPMVFVARVAARPAGIAGTLESQDEGNRAVISGGFTGFQDSAAPLAQGGYGGDGQPQQGQGPAICTVGLHCTEIIDRVSDVSMRHDVPFRGRAATEVATFSHPWLTLGHTRSNAPVCSTSVSNRSTARS